MGGEFHGIDSVVEQVIEPYAGMGIEFADVHSASLLQQAQGRGYLQGDADG
jgi:hypothetical protein